MRGSVVLSSLPLQVLFYFNYYLLWVYYIIAIISFIYKDAVLPYPQDILGWECSALVFLFIIDAARIALGTKGNKTRQRTPLFFSFALGIPVVLGYVFFLQWQTYILRLDQIFNAITIVFLVLEMLLSLLTLATFSRQRLNA